MISCIMIGIGQQRSSPAHTAGHTTRHSLGAEKMMTTFYTKKDEISKPEQVEPQDFCNQGLIYITFLGDENIYFDRPDQEGKAGFYTKAYDPDLFQTGFLETSILQPYQKVKNAYDEICFKGTPAQKASFELLMKDYEASIFDDYNWHNCYNILQLEGLII